MEHIRPRYWYAVLASCGGNSVSARWEIQWTNHGGWTQQEFSHDDQGLLQTYSLCGLMSCFASLCYWMDRRASRSYLRRQHPLTMWIAMAASFFTANTVAHTIHLCQYANDGKGFPVVQVMGRWMGVIFQVGLSLILIAIAKGWSVGTDWFQEDKRFICFGVCFLLGQAMVYYWHARVQDPASTRYMYDTLPGMFIVGLRLIGLLWFLIELYSTLQYYHPSATGRSTYIQLGGVFGFWFLSFIIYVCIGPIFSAHVRDKAVILFMVLTDLAAMLILTSWFRAGWVAENLDTSGQVQGRYTAVSTNTLAWNAYEASCITPLQQNHERFSDTTI